MTTETLLFLIMIIVLIGAFPAWPHSKSWGYTPTGVLTLLVIVFIVWAIAGDRPLFRRSVGTTVNDVGQDIKSAGRDVADSVRDATN